MSKHEFLVIINKPRMNKLYTWIQGTSVNFNTGRSANVLLSLKYQQLKQSQYRR